MVRIALELEHAMNHQEALVLTGECGCSRINRRTFWAAGENSKAGEAAGGGGPKE